MTITVDTIVTAPVVATGASQALAFPFKVYTDGEIEVVTVIDGVEAIVSNDLYTVTRNTFLGFVLEGGSVQLNVSAVAAGVSVFLRANPDFEQAQVFELGNFRAPSLNEMADRSVLRDLRLAYDITGAANGVAGFAADAAASAALAAGYASVLANYVADIQLRPEYFGCVSGALGPAASVANTIAMNLAINNVVGAKVDGGGRSYDISGLLRDVTGARIANLMVRQRSTDVTLEKTWLVDGLSTDVLMENVTVNMMDLAQTAGMGQCSGFQFSSLTGQVRFMGCGVIRGGGITGTKVISCTDFKSDGYRATMFAPAYPSMPSDDVCQAMEIQLCSNVTVRRSDISNMNCTWPGKPNPGRGFSRGIVVGQSSDVKLIDNDIRNLEQTIDVSGVLNTDVLISGNRLTDSGTWGIKCANQFRRITICGNIITRPGFSGITLSAPASFVVAQQPIDIHICGNRITNCGASGLYPSGTDGNGPTGPTAISIYGRDIALAGYPAGVRILDNTITDDQTVKTMVWGIDALQVNAVGLPILLPVVGNIPRNRERNNGITGFIGGRTRGISYDRGSFSGATAAASQSIPSGVWTSVVFANPDLDDTSGIHDPAAANTQFVPRISSPVIIGFETRFSASATGQRGVRLVNNGGVSEVGLAIRNSDGASVNTQVASSAQSMFNGITDYFEFQVFQNSGGALNIDLTATFLKYNALEA